MGAILKILANKELPQRELHNSRMFIDLSENIHIHFRELRLMFGAEEFFEFVDILKKSATEVKQYLRAHPDYKEQEVFDGLIVAGGLEQQLVPLQKSPQPHESKYFPNRLQIELQEERIIDAIHIHYRDYRLAMNIQTFRELAHSMKDALDALETHLAQNKYEEGQHEFRKTVARDGWKEKKLTFRGQIRHKLKKLLGKY